jgi:DNA-binding YbaB/EbfC family protein
MQGMNFGNLMKQAQKMQQEMGRIQQELKNRVVEGAAGGGAVRVQANGQQEIVSVKIDPEVLDPEDVEIVQEMVQEASNEALKKARQMAQEAMGKVAGGMGLPPGLV